MPAYRVISEPPPIGALLKEDRQRRLRGDASVRRSVVTVHAPDMLTALKTIVGELGDHSVTSIEETVPVAALFVTDEELGDLLRHDNDDLKPLHPCDYDDEESIYAAADFVSTVEAVAAKLGERLLPGLFLSRVDDEDGGHALMQMRDEATGTDRTKTVDLRDLTRDREACGWEGIVAIAGAVVDQAQELV